eukprot:141912-Chlamydomonas_euryale.AAC.9
MPALPTRVTAWDGPPPPTKHTALCGLLAGPSGPNHVAPCDPPGPFCCVLAAANASTHRRRGCKPPLAAAVAAVTVAAASHGRAEQPAPRRGVGTAAAPPPLGVPVIDTEAVTAVAAANAEARRTTPAAAGRQAMPRGAPADRRSAVALVPSMLRPSR